MSRSQSQPPPVDGKERCFGLRIESNLLQIAIATPLPDGRYRLEIDAIECPAPGGWLNSAGNDLLVEALVSLVDQHEIRRERVAISLDGEFCVTRVAMGTSVKVDKEQSSLADRVPRYLQLGPGEKVTGSSRTRIDASTDYAVTGVVNRTLVQLMYDALRRADLDVDWVEPSLVGVARLMGMSKIGGDTPIMIADGTGSRWDVGIACSGRLLLDYRPASATTAEGFRDALDGHISRLKRFCHRHRGIAGGELNRLLICGSGSKVQHVLDVLGDSIGLQLELMRVPNLPDLYVMADEDRQPTNVPAVATVLPLLIDVPRSEVPDLLDDVRRAPDLPWTTRILQTAWPVIAAVLIICISYGLVSKERSGRAGAAGGRAAIESQIKATNVQLSTLAEHRELYGHLKSIQMQTTEPDWNTMLDRITQSLPDTARLNEFRVESDGYVLLTGTVMDESLVFELVNNFRLLPEITQVALSGTAPDETTRGTQFTMRLTSSHRAAKTEAGAQNE